MNGLAGVFSGFNQKLAGGMSSGGYYLAGAVCSLVLCGSVLLIKRQKNTPLFTNPRRSLVMALLYGLACGGGNLLLLIALETLPSSVQYPFVTGGTICFSVIVNCFVLREEKLTVKKALSALFALAASVAACL